MRSLKSGALAQEVTLPGVGTVSLSGRRKHREFFMTFVSFTDPGSTYRGVLADDLAADVGLSLVRRSAPEGFDPEEFVTTQEFVTGKDGTRIPMFVMHRRDRKLDGSAISLLYGYGAFWEHAPIGRRRR